MRAPSRVSGYISSFSLTERRLTRSIPSPKYPAISAAVDPGFASSLIQAPHELSPLHEQGQGLRTLHYHSHAFIRDPEALDIA
ncbi:Uncharacterized protein FKW44_023225, partial [Caligus rogercresseyi]